MKSTTRAKSRLPESGKSTVKRTQELDFEDPLTRKTVAWHTAQMFENGNKFKWLRTSQNLTPTDVALAIEKQTGIETTPSDVSNWEHRRADPSIEQAAAWIDYLYINKGAMVTWEVN